MTLYGMEKLLKPTTVGRLQTQAEKRYRLDRDMPKNLSTYNIYNNSVEFWEAVPYYLFEFGFYPKIEVNKYGKTGTLLKNPITTYYLRTPKDENGCFTEIKINKILHDFCQYILENFHNVAECITYAEKEMQEKVAQEKTKREREEIKRRKEESYRVWKTQTVEKAMEITDQNVINLGKIAWEKYIGGEFPKRFLSIKLEIDALNRENVAYGKRALKERLYSHNKASKYFFYLYTGFKLPATDKGTFEIIDNWEEYENEKFI